MILFRRTLKKKLIASVFFVSTLSGYAFEANFQKDSQLKALIDSERASVRLTQNNSSDFSKAIADVIAAERSCNQPHFDSGLSPAECDSKWNGSYLKLQDFVYETCSPSNQFSLFAVKSCVKLLDKAISISISKLAVSESRAVESASPRFHFKICENISRFPNRRFPIPRGVDCENLRTAEVVNTQKTFWRRLQSFNKYVYASPETEAIYNDLRNGRIREGLKISIVQITYRGRQHFLSQLSTSQVPNQTVNIDSLLPGRRYNNALEPALVTTKEQASIDRRSRRRETFSANLARKVKHLKIQNYASLWFPERVSDFYPSFYGVTIAGISEGFVRYAERCSATVFDGAPESRGCSRKFQSLFVKRIARALPSCDTRFQVTEENASLCRNFVKEASIFTARSIYERRRLSTRLGHAFPEQLLKNLLNKEIR